MKATPLQQRQLFDLQQLDLKIARTRRGLSQLPEHALAAELNEKLAAQRPALLEAQRRKEELEQEIARLQSDIDTAQARTQRNNERLASTSDAKQARALEHENETLAARITTLEDRELEALEASESAQTAFAKIETEIGALREEQRRVAQRVSAAEAEATTELARLTEERDQLAVEIPGELREHYEQIREHAGIGVARLRGNVSEASNMTLPPGELQALRAVPADELRYCPATGVILVDLGEDDEQRDVG